MSSNIKKEFIVDGLCCANCATKVEDKVKNLEGVASSSMNFVNKILTVEISNKNNLDSILNKMKDIVKAVEPDAVISEEQIKKSNKKSFILEGLCCTNCAAKIEDRTKNTPGIKSVSLDFISKKLSLEVDNKYKMDSIVDEVIKIIRDIEPDIQVLSEENTKKKTIHHKRLLRRFMREKI